MPTSKSPRPSLHVTKVSRAHRKFEKGPFDWNQSSSEKMQAKAKEKIRSREAQEEANRVAREDPFWLANSPERLQSTTEINATCGITAHRAAAGPLALRYEEMAAIYCQKWIAPLSLHEQHRRLCSQTLCYSEKLRDEMAFELDAMGCSDLDVSLFGRFLYCALAKHLGWVWGCYPAVAASPSWSIP